MLGICKIIILFYFQYIFVQCSIQNLSVRKSTDILWQFEIIFPKHEVNLGMLNLLFEIKNDVTLINSELVQRKRQQTVDLCLKFNAENERLQRMNNQIYPDHGKSRVKRSLDPMPFGNPALNSDDVKRVENIVDQLYDDLEDQGEHVTYRHKKLKPPSTVTPYNRTSYRRLDFAPKLLLPPIPETKQQNRTTDNSRVPVPWHKKWKYGIIPFFIDPKTYDSHLAEIIINAFDYFERVTCIRLQRLREKPTDKESLQKVEWVYITNPTGIRQCVHSNARKKNKGVQLVVFGYDCMSTGEISHEVMHILGFSHEHTRQDRDQYITVLWDNIKPGYKKYFEVRGPNQLLSLPYDYASVLHYPPRAFSKNGQITVLGPAGIKLGQRQALSEIDVEKTSVIFGIECVDRNKNYLLTTCPSVMKGNRKQEQIKPQQIKDYFKERLWPFGIINYKIRDKMEFSIEERENINAVIRHIEKETCLEFRDLSADAEDGYEDEDKNDKNKDEDGEGNSEDNDDDKKAEENPKEIDRSGKGGNVVSLDTEDRESENEVVDLKEDSVIKDLDAGAVDEQAIDNEEEKRTELRTNDKKPALRQGNATKKVETKAKVVSVSQRTTKTLAKQNLGKVRVKRVRRSIEPKEKRTPSKPSAKKKSAPKTQKARSPSRRHANSILLLTRSPYPGCQCPPPGKPKGDQVLEINQDCFNSVNDLLHLFVHVLGLDHQHNLHDRDSFLHIVWDKLSPEIAKDMKEKLPPAASVGFPYDYQSVMHYPWLQIKEGRTSIMYPIWNDGWAMGHWQGLSSTDVQKLNLLYFEQCSERKKHAQEDKN